MRTTTTIAVLATVLLVPAAAAQSSPDGPAMVVVRGPVSVRMGSPATERGRMPAPDSAAEPLHTVVIPRSFAISATEVTVAQFRRFLDANPEVAARHQYDGAPSRMAEMHRLFSPDDDGPAIAVTWYEAAMFCNWVERFQTPDVVEDREDAVLRVSDRDARTRRGGAFPYGAAFARSALRGPVTSLPTNRRDNVGFRIARTVR